MRGARLANDETTNTRRDARFDVSRAHPVFKRDYDFFRAVAFPPLRPAAFFCAVVPPWEELLRELLLPDFLPPRLDAPGEFAIFAARSARGHLAASPPAEDLLDIGPAFRSLLSSAYWAIDGALAHAGVVSA